MARRRIKWVLGLTLGVALVLGALYGALARFPGEPVPDHSFFARDVARPLVIAHRGGAGLWPENTISAFEGARRVGADVIELDVRATSDGVLVVVHDATVERTTDGAGRVGAMSLAALKRLDAGYRWSADGGRTFPFRGQGITIPTLDEVFARLPEMRFNIEPKQDAPSLVRPLCDLIRRHKMADRVIIGSFRQAVLDEFRRECREVATSASPGEASKFLAMYRAGLGGAYSPPMQALQVPEYAGGVQVLSRGFVDAAHDRNLEVHAWTVNETADMRRLLGFGVDGIMTDYPDRLLDLLGRPR